MRKLNINGKEGPTIKKIFTCEGCKWLGGPYSTHFTLSSSQYRCLYEDFLPYQASWQKNAQFSIGNNMNTPQFCPYLLRKNREEKINEINEYQRTEKEIT